MICFAKPVLTENLYIVQKGDFYAICVICTLDERPSIFIRDKPIFSTERATTTWVELKKNLKRLGTKMN
jgi:hypothetical protein